MSLLDQIPHADVPPVAGAAAQRAGRTVFPGLEPARAVLTDLDGTLFNTEHAWLQATEAWLRGHTDIDPAPFLARCRGARLEDAFQILLGAIDIDRADEARVAVLRADYLAAGAVADLSAGHVWLPGARELLEGVRELGLPIALVTSSLRNWVEALAPTLDLALFDVVITADDVSHHKPHPLPYLQAAELLGVPPTDCTVFEDSRPGVTAALAAGCQVFAVAGQHGMQAGTRTFLLDSLAEITAADLVW